MTAMSVDHGVVHGRWRRMHMVASRHEDGGGGGGTVSSAGAQVCEAVQARVLHVEKVVAATAKETTNEGLSGVCWTVFGRHGGFGW